MSFQITLAEFVERVLSTWQSFTIWGAGKGGKRFYRSLPAKEREKVVAFCDVDRHKIEKGKYIYEESDEFPKPSVPILHFREAQPPFVVCVKQDLTEGGLEANIAELKLVEGRDFYFFS